MRLALCLLVALCFGSCRCQATADSNGTQLCQLTLPARHAAPHKLAVVLPYRGRPRQLRHAVQHLHRYLRAQSVKFDIFVLQQTRTLRFNRGLLFNAGFLLLDGSEYDHFCIHDIDTLPTFEGRIPYEYPTGNSPYHLTPSGIHPIHGYEFFAGGNLVFTRDQLRVINGFGVHFWGWGEFAADCSAMPTRCSYLIALPSPPGMEDNNMAHRLNRAGMWPLQRPEVQQPANLSYFMHIDGGAGDNTVKDEVRVWTRSDGSRAFRVVRDGGPKRANETLAGLQQELWTYEDGLSTTVFRVVRMSPYKNLATRIVVDLHCDHDLTPWCAL